MLKTIIKEVFLKKEEIKMSRILIKKIISIILLINMRVIVYSIECLFSPIFYTEFFLHLVEISFIITFITFFVFNELGNKKKYISLYLIFLFLSNFITICYFEIKFPLADIGLYLYSFLSIMELLILILLLYPIYLLNRLYLKKKYKSDNCGERL